MQSSSEEQRKLLQEEIAKTASVISDLQKERLLLEESENELPYAQDFLNGHYKCTFLIQGDDKVGKTTFLNVLLDDALIPSSRLHVIIVQYDETQVTPVLFTTHLNEIFNSDKQIFVIKQENLRETGVQGSDDIRTTLKQASIMVNSQSESMKVFVIKYRIPWLKELIRDEFILNRIQFVDIDMPEENDSDSEDIQEEQIIASPEDILRLEEIISSPNFGNIFVADGTQLFTANTAAKYRELSENKEKSLLIINRTDLLGPTAHLHKIQQNQSILCSKLNVESIESIEKQIKDLKVTEEMRHEIFLQSFYDDQRIDQDMLIDGDVIYFVSALLEFNRILLCKYKDCKYDEEKADLCSLFDERNNGDEVYQDNKENAARSNLDILQYYLNEEPLYQSNFGPIKKAVCNIAKKTFEKQSLVLSERVKESRLKVLKYKSSLTKSLTEQAIQQKIQDLQNLRKKIKDLLEERWKKIEELVENFEKKTVDRLETFFKDVKNLNPDLDLDFYSVKANHPKEISRLTKRLDESATEAENRFENDYKQIEIIYWKKIDELNNEIKMDDFMTDIVKEAHKKLEHDSQSLARVIKGLSNMTHNTIITFIRDGKASNKFRSILQRLVKLFIKVNNTNSFEHTLNDSKKSFKEMMETLLNVHRKEQNRKRDKFELRLTDSVALLRELKI